MQITKPNNKSETDKFKVPDTKTFDIDFIPENDPRVMSLVSKGQTVGVFQLESDIGIQWAKRLKPNTIGEISDLISIIRPGPLESGMSDVYIKRKHGGEEITYINSALENALSGTYGTLVYQEQTLQVTKDIAGFSDTTGNSLRSAIAKKKPEMILALKNEFLEKSAVKGIVTKEQAEEIFGWIEKGQRYLFNKCLALDTTVDAAYGAIAITQLKRGDYVNGPDGFVKVLDIIDNGRQPVYRMTTETGKTIKCTINHKFLCNNNDLKTLGNILINTDHVHCGIFTELVKSIEYIGIEQTINIEINSLRHLYYANGFTNSNSHGVCYATLGYQTAYLKTHFPTEFYTAWLTFSSEKPEPREEIYRLVQDARLHNVIVKPPDIKHHNVEFEILSDKNILFGLGHIKSLGKSAITNIKTIGKDLDTFGGFIKNVPKIKRNVAEALIKSGGCDSYEMPRTEMLKLVHILYGVAQNEDDNTKAIYKKLTPNELNYVLSELDEKPLDTLLEEIIANEVCVKKRIPTIQDKIEFFRQKLADTNRKKSIWEKLYLGLNLTCSAADDYKAEDKIDKNLITCKAAFFSLPKSTFSIHVVLDEISLKKTGEKSKTPGAEYAYLSVSDNSYALNNVILWPNTYEKFKEYLIEGSVYSIICRKDSWNGRDQVVCQNLEFIG